MVRSYIKVAQAKEETVDIDYLPRGRLPRRRRALADEFDRECGYAYDHELVFIRYATTGAREYECSNCGEREFIDAFTCDPDIHEMLEVGALELAFLPHVNRSVHTMRQMAADRHTLDNWHRRQGHNVTRKNTTEEEELDV